MGSKEEKRQSHIRNNHGEGTRQKLAWTSCACLFIKHKPLSHSVSADRVAQCVYLINEQNEHFWAKFGLPPSTSSGVDQAPDQCLVFPFDGPLASSLDVTTARLDDIYS